MRLREARLLLEYKFYSGAYYLAGYSVECGLKACIAKQTQKFEFPELRRVKASHTHNLHELLQLAGLDDELRNQSAASPQLETNWRTVRDWSEQSRYKQYQGTETIALLQAVQNKKEGIIP